MRRDEKHGDQNYATSIALTDNNMQIAYKGTAKLEIVCQKLSLKQRLKEVLLSKRLAALFAAGVRIVTTHPNYPRSERILFVGDIFVLSHSSIMEGTLSNPVVDVKDGNLPLKFSYKGQVYSISKDGDILQMWRDLTFLRKENHESID